MCQTEQQGNTAAPSVPVQWSKGQLVLTPADWVIAIRLTDWAMEFMSRPIVAQLDARICRGRRGEAKQALKAAEDVQMAMLRLCFAQMLDRVYSSAHTVESVAFGTKDCITEDCLRHWASDDAEQDPIIGWISVGCSSRPPARLADIIMATSSMPDYLGTAVVARLLPELVHAHLLMLWLWDYVSPQFGLGTTRRYWML